MNEKEKNFWKEVKEWESKVMNWNKKLSEEIEHVKGLIRNGNIKLSEEEEEILVLAESYLKDSLHFLKNEDIFRAIESISISWSYLDSLIKIKKIKPKNKGFFTK